MAAPNPVPETRAQAAESSSSSAPGRRRPGWRRVALLLAVFSVGALGFAAARLVASSGGLASTADHRTASSPVAASGVGTTTSLTSGGPATAATPGAPGTSSTPPASAAPPLVAQAGAPWTAWRPNGQGSLVTFVLPAPWSGVPQRIVKLVAYLPAGYATSGRSYPVVYEAPFSFASFEAGINVTAMLDAQIASGALPASIFVFVRPAHSPIHDTECADSTDHREWIDTFLATTVVQAVDHQFRTIATPAARAVMGFSQGGFCAAMLTLQHPGVFGTAISVSGYYQAGIRSNQTPKAWVPFGGKASAEAAVSPLNLVKRLTAAERRSTLLILEADPGQPFYGPQYAAMVAAAHRAGVHVIPVPMRGYHSWPVVAASLPPMLLSLARHEVSLGVFA